MRHLPLASGVAVGIELAELEAAEQRLDGGGGVAIRARIDDLEALPVYHVLSLRTHMIRRIVPEDDCVLLPARRVVVEHLGHLVKECCHYVAVGGGVGQAEPHLAAGVQGSDHRQARRDRVEPSVAVAASPGPQPADEAGLVQPGLVHVDDAPALLQQLQQRQGILLPLDQDLGGVRVGVQLLGLEVAEAELVLQDLPHLLDADCEVV